MDKELVEQIRRERLWALSRTHHHRLRLARVKFTIRAITTLGIIVPVWFLGLRYLAKGGALEEVLSVLWTVLSVALLSLSIQRAVSDLDGRAQKHYAGHVRNLRLAGEAQELLRSNATAEAVNWYLKNCTETHALNLFLNNQPKNAGRSKHHL